MPGIVNCGWDNINERWIPILVDENGRLLVDVSETAADAGVATGGSQTTLEDTTKDWATNMWADAYVQVEISGVEYHRRITSNTDDTLTFNALPAGVSVVSGNTYSITRAAIINPLLPINKSIQHNVAVVGGADILGAVLAPTNLPCKFAVEVAFDAAGVFSLRLTNGGVTVGENFNQGVVLPANAVFRFTHLVHTGDTINYRYSVNATMLSMRVQELDAAS